MAKIAIISQNFSAEVEALAESLFGLRHDVVVITDQASKIPQRYTRTVLTPFKKWSALEALRFIPKFLGSAPHIWHFVFNDSTKESPTSAHFILATFAKALPRRSVVTTFWNSWPIKAFLFSKFAGLNDLMTFGTREGLMRAKRNHWIPPTCEAEVMPPLPGLRSDESSGRREDLQRLCNHLKPFLYVPHNELPKSILDSARLSGVRLLVRGSRAEQTHDDNLYYLPPSANEGDVEYCISESIGILSAFHQFSPLELIRLQNSSQKMAKPIVGHPAQNDVLPGFCLHGKSGFLVESDREFQKLFHSSHWAHFKYQAVDPGLRQLQDSVLNDLNRLYTKLLAGQ